MTQLVLNIENNELTDILGSFSIKQQKTMEEIAIEAIKNFIQNDFLDSCISIVDSDI